VPKNKISHVKIFYTVVISVAIFRYNLKHLGETLNGLEEAPSARPRHRDRIPELLKIKGIKMKNSVSFAVAMAAASVCGLASAGVLTFDNFDSGIYSNGDMLTDGAATVTVRGQGGFDGAVINGSDPTSCEVAVCPAGNLSKYYAGLNDGGVSFGLGGDSFNLSGIDFGFILPIDALIGFTVGQLVVTGNDGTSIAKDFALQNASTGDYSFAHWNFDGLFGNTRFTEVTFTACLYTDAGACVNPANNQAQFALDNIAFVPEPASLPLVALSLAAMLAVCRRRKSA
jgi:hypothetical protein